MFIKDGKMIFNGSVDKIINDNLQPSSIIKYYVNDEIKHKHLPNSEKSEEISHLLKQGFEIHSIEPEKPTLEEIFYNVKS